MKQSRVYKICFSFCQLRKKKDLYISCIIYKSLNEKEDFAHNFVFIFLINLLLQLAVFSYAVVPDADGDGVPDDIDQCAGSVTTVVDQFGCSCAQKNCPTDGNPCTDDCSVIGQLPTCTFVNNNNNPCPGGHCSAGQCMD